MKAHLFDMDGILIDSEPFWRAAEIKVFTQEGVPFTEDMCRETVGMRIDEVVAYWNRKTKLSMDVRKVSDNIQDELIYLVKKDGQPLNGVLNTLELIKSKGRKLALASSSSQRIIDTVVDKLNIGDYFNELHSAEFEKNGKPFPDVFLSAAKSLKTDPKHCIVYEDSRNGMKAGLAAGMKVVIIPEFPEPHLDWHNEAHLKWSSLNEFDLELVEKL